MENVHKMTSNAETWKLREKQLTVPGERKLDMSEKSDVVELLNWHIPQWDSKLHTIPHLTRIRRKDLFSDQDVIYDSEVKDVYQCLCEVPGLSGIAVHSYNQNNAKKTFTDVRAKFEIDWILVNSSGVFVIEVGYAKEASNSKNIINKKVEQITSRSKYILQNIFSASKFHSEQDPLSESEIKLIVALPNTPFSQIRIWMEEENNRCITDDHSLIFFTQETLTLGKVFRGSRLQECILSSLLCGEKPEQHQCQLKFVSALFVIGKFAVLKADSPIVGSFGLLKPDASEYTAKQRKYKKEQNVRNNLDSVLDQIELPEKLVLTSEQYDCIEEIIFGNVKSFSVVGEAGTGKSTILILLLIYYTGRHQEKEKRKRCLFIVPASKWGFREFVEAIADKLCDRTFAIVCSLGTFTERFHPDITDDCVVLVDELYNLYNIAEKDTSQVDSRHFLKRFSYSPLTHKCVYSYISSGQLENYPHVDHGINQIFESTFIMRKWLRNSSHIAKLAVKLKRRAHLSTRYYTGLFDSGQPNTSVFATSSQNSLLVAKLENCKNLKQDLIISYCRSYTSPREFTTNRSFRVQVDNDNIHYWDFTGIEGLSVAVIVDLPKLPEGKSLENLLLFLYNAITRARTDLTVFCSSSIFYYVKDLFQLDETDKALNKLQSGGMLSWDELVSCWPSDDRQVAFIILAVLNSDLKLSQDIVSLVLQNSTLLIKAFGFIEAEIEETGLKEKITPAIFLFFALMNPSKTDKSHDYIEKFVSHRPKNLQRYLRLSKYFRQSLLSVSCWNRDLSLLEKYHHLIPFDTISRRNSPLLTALWFPDKRSISECYNDSWDFEGIKQIARTVALLNRIHLVPAVVSNLHSLLARGDANASEFKRNGGITQVCVDLFFCILTCKEWSMLSSMIKAFPECIKSKDRSNNYLLHYAATHCDETVPFEIVLESNIECLFMKDSNNLTPIEVAFFFGHIQPLNFLFDSYLDLFLQRGVPEKMPLTDIFSQLGDLGRLKKLLEKMSRPLSPRDTFGVFETAIRHGNAHIVQFLLNIGAFENISRPEKLFFEACASGSVEICSMIKPIAVKKYKKVFCQELNPVFSFASIAKQNAVEIAKYLLEQDVDNYFCMMPKVQSKVFFGALISRNHSFIRFLSAYLDGKRLPLSNWAKASVAVSQESQGKPVSCSNYDFFNLDFDLIKYVSEFYFEKNKETVYGSISWFEKNSGKINDDVRKVFLKFACELGILPLVSYFSVYHPHLLTASICKDESSLLRIAHSHGRKEVTKYLMKHHPALLVQACSMEIMTLLLLC